MNKFTATIDLASRRLLSFVLVLFACYGMALAADLGALELGKEYQVKGDMDDWYATFTAPSSGKVTVKTTPNASAWRPYTDASYDNEEESFSFQYGVGGSFTAVEGKTYYFYADFVMDGFTFSLEMESADTGITLTSADPVENSTFSSADGGYIDLLFSEAPVIGENGQVTIKAQGGKEEVLASGASEGGRGYQIFAQKYIRLHIGAILNDWYDSGDIKAADSFTINFTGLQNADGKLYNGDGVLTLTYYAATPTSRIISAKNGDGSIDFTGKASADDIKFLSYFMSNNPNGKLVFTFSKAMDTTKGSVVLMYGNSEGDAGSQYIEKVLTPVWSEGNTVMTLDFYGQHFRPADLITNGTLYSEITLGLRSMTDVDGLHMYTTNSGSLGSTYFTFPYTNVSTTIACEIEVSGINVNYYINDYDNIYFDGVKFEWVEDGESKSVIVPISELNITKTSAGGVTIAEFDVTIPTEARGKADVTVSLNNLETADGTIHNDLSTVVDSTLKILSSTPAQGAEVASIAAKSQILVELNRTDLGYVALEVTDVADGTYMITRGTLNADSSNPGHYTYTKYGATVNFIKDHTYKLEVLGWNQASDANGSGYNNPAARASITFQGATEVFSFSTVKYVGATPASGSVIESANDCTFEVEYDGLVKLDAATTFVNLGQGSKLAFSEINPIDAEDGYAKKWQLVIAPETAATLNYNVSLTVAATDQNGKVVEGDQGTEASSYVKLEYDLDFNVPEMTFTPAAGSTVKTLASIVVEQSLGISRNYNVTTPIQVYNGKDLVATLTDANITDETLTSVDGSGSQGSDSSVTEERATAVRLTMPAEITTAGSYTVIIPRQFFILGDQFNTYNSKAYNLNYTVEGSTPDVEFAVVSVPADGAELTEVPASLLLTFPNHIGAGLSQGKAYITGPDNTKTELADAGWGDEDNQMVQPILASAVSAKGTYTVTFPAGYFILTDASERDSDSPEFTISFNYAPATSIPDVEFAVTSTPADGAELTEVPASLTLTFGNHTAVTAGTGSAYMTSPGGSVQMTLAAPSAGTEANQMVQALLTGAIAADGTYNVVFPAGYFSLTDEYGRVTESPEFTISFNYSKPLPCIPTPANHAVLEAFSGKSLVLDFSTYKSVAKYTGSFVVTLPSGKTSAVAVSASTVTVSSNKVTIDLSALITTLGKYSIQFRANNFKLTPNSGSTSYNTAFTTDFTITGREVECTSTPEDGVEVESCESIILDITNPLANYNWLDKSSTPVYATLTTPSGETHTLSELSWNNSTYGIKQSLDGLATESGKYTVTFPAMYFWYTPGMTTLATGGTPSAEFTRTFTIAAKAADDEVTYEILPDNTNPVTEINAISVKFNKTITGMNYQLLSQIGVAKDNEIIYNYNSENDEWAGLNTETLTIVFGTPFKANGRYLISIPEGLVQFGEWYDIDSPAIMASYVIDNVEELTTVNFTSVPAHQSTVTSCDRIYLTFTDFGACNASYLAQPTITPEGGSATLLGNPEWGEELNQLELDLKGTAKEDGTYTVNFPKGCILLGIDEDDSNPVDNPAFDLTFTVSGQTGVNTITVDNSDVRYYNLQGVEVKTPAPGIYIRVQGTTVSKVTVK